MISSASCTTCKKLYVYNDNDSTGKYCSRKCASKGAIKPPYCRKCKKYIPKSKRYSSKFSYWMKICKACGAKKGKLQRRRNKRKNPAKWKSWTLRSSLKSRGRLEVESKKIEQELLQKKTCTYCKKEIPIIKGSYDHIIPLSRGGKHDWSNLQLIDLSCNIMKGELTDSEYRELLKFLIDKPKLYEILKKRLKASGWMYRRK